MLLQAQKRVGARRTAPLQSQNTSSTEISPSRIPFAPPAASTVIARTGSKLLTASAREGLGSRACASGDSADVAATSRRRAASRVGATACSVTIGRSVSTSTLTVYVAGADATTDASSARLLGSTGAVTAG